IVGALSGKALTVLGAVDAASMGITLPHEHLLIDFEVMFKEPAAATDKGLAYQPVSLANVGWVRQNFNANLDNLRLLDEQTALDEIMLFRRAGGQTVIDPTNVSLSRDPLALTRISRATGLNIVMGAPPTWTRGARTRSSARSSARSRSAWATRASAPGSSARSATRGRGRRTKRRSCAPPWRPSARRAPR